MFGHRRDRHDDVGPTNRVGSPVPQLGPTRDGDALCGTLMFATATCAGGLDLDCLLDVSGEGTRAPVALAVLLPECAEMAAYETRLINRWLADGTPVEVALPLELGDPRVKLIAGPTTVFLDLRGASTG